MQFKEGGGRPPTSNPDQGDHFPDGPLDPHQDGPGHDGVADGVLGEFLPASERLDIPVVEAVAALHLEA